MSVLVRMETHEAITHAVQAKVKERQYFVSLCRDIHAHRDLLVHRNIEESLDLRRMEVHRLQTVSKPLLPPPRSMPTHDDMITSSFSQHVRNELCGDGRS
jgi:hypothetical protein